MAMNWKCYECNMTFTNPNLLQKHKSRFCVGGALGDPDQLMLRRGFYTERERESDPPADVSKFYGLVNFHKMQMFESRVSFIVY